MDGAESVEVTALAINVSVPEDLRWTDARRGETFLHVGFRMPESPEFAALVSAAADRAAALWAAHRGLG